MANTAEEREFNDYDTTHAYIQEHARNNGYALSQGRKKYDKCTPPTVRRVDFRCDKGGTVRGSGVIRKSSSRMTECPFDLRLIRIDSASGRWRVQLAMSSHNHPLSDELSQHTKYRKPTAEDSRRIDELSTAGVPPRMIVSTLLVEGSRTALGSKEIYNRRVKQRTERLGGLTPIERLIRELEDDAAWAVSYTVGEDSHVNYLFFAYRPAIELAEIFPEILLADATYRTNRYNMPLLHFMGVTCLDSSFSSAFCFMAAENELMYRRAVGDYKRLVVGEAHMECILTDDEDALKNAFLHVFPFVPQLLCFWHVEKRVLTKAKSLWRVNNTDEETNEANKEKKREFMERWKKARAIYTGQATVKLRFDNCNTSQIISIDANCVNRWLARKLRRSLMDSTKASNSITLNNHCS